MKDYDTFFEAPGTVESRACRVCGTECVVIRDSVGPTSWAAAVGKLKTKHDYFYCPHREQPWHERALSLVEAIEDSPSQRVSELMRQDLIELLNKHGCNLGANDA